MSVTVEGTPTQAAAAAAISVTWSHTAGGDGLFVGGVIDRTNGFASCTFNGAPLTELFDQPDNGAGSHAAGGYLMVAPAAGAHNVVLTGSITPDVIWGGAVGLTGLEQSSVANAHRTVYVNGAGGAGGPTVTVADSQSGDLVIDCAGTFNTTIAVGSGQTSRVEDDSIVGGAISSGVSTEGATGANTIMSWTGGSYWAIGACALIAAAGGIAIPVLTRQYRERWN